MRTLHDYFREVVRVDGTLTTNNAADAVSRWLMQDDLRGVVYDGIVAPGPTTANVLAALADRATEGVEEDGRDTIAPDAEDITVVEDAALG